MENIQKFHPLLSKYNDAIVVEKSVQDILKVSLFSTREVADACSTSVVTPYLLTAEENLPITMANNIKYRLCSPDKLIINLSGLHRRYFILFAIVI